MYIWTVRIQDEEWDEFIATSLDRKDALNKAAEYFEDLVVNAPNWDDKFEIRQNWSRIANDLRNQGVTVSRKDTIQYTAFTTIVIEQFNNN